MERIVIVAYKPLPGREKELESLVKSHWQILNEEGLVSGMTPIICRSESQEIIEVFGWKSQQAIQEAHTNARVHQLWEEFSGVCSYIPVMQISECHQVFSEFTPV